MKAVVKLGAEAGADPADHADSLCHPKPLRVCHCDKTDMSQTAWGTAEIASARCMQNNPMRKRDGRAIEGQTL